MAVLRCADVLVSKLINAGVRHCFALSGNQIMSIYDASINTDLQLFHTRHEAAAVHMADAVGRLTGKPGVALVTAAPGIANCPSALYVAKAAESPVLLLSGDSPVEQDGHGAFQELDQVAMTQPVTKQAWRVTEPRRIRQEIQKALSIASSGRPGPVHLVLPVDVLEAKLDSADYGLETPKEASESVGEEEYRWVVDDLLVAQRPLVLVGPAVMHSPAFLEAQKYGRETGVPTLGMESPRGLNDPSLGALAEITREADLIILVGKALDFSLQFGKDSAFNSQCRFIQIDPDQRVLDQGRRNIQDLKRLSQILLPDPAHFLRYLFWRLAEIKAGDGDWYDTVSSAITYRPQAWWTGAQNIRHTVEVLSAVNEFLSEAPESVFISDGGEFGQWAQACISAPTRIINGPSGAIGGAIPFAMGARVVHPDARIVCVLGDGAFGFNAFEYDTAIRYNLPFIGLVGNDAGWNAEIQIQIKQFGKERVFGCELLPTRYDEVVKYLGGVGRSATDPAEVKESLREAWESGLPSCINVSINRNAAPMIRRMG